MRKVSAFLLLLIISLLVFTGYPTLANPDTLSLTPNAVGSYSQFVEVPNSGFVWGDQFESQSFSGWTASSGSIVSSPTAHSGSYCALLTGTTSKNLPSSYSALYFRTYFQTDTIPTSSFADLIAIRSTVSGYLAFLHYAYSAGGDTFILSALSGTSSVVQAINANQWYCIEIEYTQSAVYFWFNGAANPTLTVNYNASSVTANNIRLHWGGAAAGNWCYDGLVTSTSGPIGVEARYNLVNDSSDNTALQVTANTTQKETENLGDTSQTGTINSVTVYMRAKASAALLVAVNVVRTHSADYESGVQAISSIAFTDYSYVMNTNPNTQAAWSWDEVNALEVGARASTLTTGTIQFSEFYIVIDYSTVQTLNLSNTASLSFTSTVLNTFSEPFINSAIFSFTTAKLQVFQESRINSALMTFTSVITNSYALISNCVATFQFDTVNLHALSNAVTSSSSAFTFSTTITQTSNVLFQHSATFTFLSIHIRSFNFGRVATATFNFNTYGSILTSLITTWTFNGQAVLSFLTSMLPSRLALPLGSSFGVSADDTYEILFGFCFVMLVVVVGYGLSRREHEDD